MGVHVLVSLGFVVGQVGFDGHDSLDQVIVLLGCHLLVSEVLGVVDGMCGEESGSHLDF